MNRPALGSFALRFVLLALLSYGLLYFSYKYYVPVHTDFMSHYYQMYRSPLDFRATNAPFIYRQISALITHLIYQSGVYYPNDIAFSDPDYDQRIFFAALLANYLGLVTAAAIAGQLVERECGGVVLPLLAGLLCLLSFHSQSIVITGLTEGISWFFIALLYLLYVREDRIAFAALLALSIFQREMIPIVFALIAAFALLLRQGSPRFNLFVLACSLICFAGYFILRQSLPLGLENQLTFQFLFENVVTSSTSARDLLFQGLLSQNVVIACIVLSGAVWIKTHSLPGMLPVLLLTLASVMCIGLAEGINNNIGRVAGMLTPAFAALAAAALRQLEVLSSGRNQQTRK